jgi:hypothetical protein
MTPPPPKQCPEITQRDLDSLRDALASAGANESSAKAAEEKMSLKDLQHKSQEQGSRGKDQKSKLPDMER